MKTLLALALALSLTLAACVAPKGQTTISGLAYDSKDGRPLIGKRIEILDARPRFSGFGIPGPVPLGHAVTKHNGRFQLIVPGKFKPEWIYERFEGLPPSHIGSPTPSDRWRISPTATKYQPDPSNPEASSVVSGKVWDGPYRVVYRDTQGYLVREDSYIIAKGHRRVLHGANYRFRRNQNGKMWLYENGRLIGTYSVVTYGDTFQP